MRQGIWMELLILGAAMRFLLKNAKKCKNPLQGRGYKG